MSDEALKIYEEKYGKDNTKPSDYILKVFLCLLTFSFLGVRQGIWRKTKWELNAENREKE